MGKRPASKPGVGQEAGKWVPSKKAATATGVAQEVASMGSVASEPHAQSVEMPTASQSRSLAPGDMEEVAGLMSTLLLINFQQVRELESSAYYVH